MNLCDVLGFSNGFNRCGGEAPRGTTSYKQFTSFSSEDVSLEPQGSELVQ